MESGQREGETDGLVRGWPGGAHGFGRPGAAQPSWVPEAKQEGVGSKAPAEMHRSRGSFCREAMGEGRVLAQKKKLGSLAKSGLVG